MRSLLESLASRAGRSTFLAALLSAFEEGGAPREGPEDESIKVTGPAQGTGTASPELWNVLSNRELDVLELLAERLSNKEIGAHLHVSPEAVKKRIRNIYKKLEVHGRREAVAKTLAEPQIRCRALPSGPRHSPPIPRFYHFSGTVRHCRWPLS